MGVKTTRPFHHDCDGCEWYGWLHVGDMAYNVYLCHTSILLRYGDEPNEYIRMGPGVMSTTRIAGPYSRGSGRCKIWREHERGNIPRQGQ